RNALIVLAEGDPVLARLMAHRFDTEKSEELNGMAFGNLFLAALTQQEGSFLPAVEEASRLLKLRGRGLPVTLYNTHRCAEHAARALAPSLRRAGSRVHGADRPRARADPRARRASREGSGHRQVERAARSLAETGHDPSRRGARRARPRRAGR